MKRRRKEEGRRRREEQERSSEGNNFAAGLLRNDISFVILEIPERHEDDVSAVDPHSLPHLAADVAQTLHPVEAVRLQPTIPQHPNHLAILFTKKQRKKARNVSTASSLSSQANVDTDVQMDTQPQWHVNIRGTRRRECRASEREPQERGVRHEKKINHDVLARPYGCIHYHTGQVHTDEANHDKTTFLSLSLSL